MPVFTLAHSLLVALLLAAPPAASEAEPEPDRVRYQRQSSSAPRIREDALERRLEWAKRTQPREAQAILPNHDSSGFRTCRKCVEPEMRAKQIAFLTNLIETSPEDDPEYPDYLFRLADHYLETKLYSELQADNLERKIDDLEAEIEAEAFAKETSKPPLSPRGSD